MGFGSGIPSRRRSSVIFAFGEAEGCLDEDGLDSSTGGGSGASWSPNGKRSAFSSRAASSLVGCSLKTERKSRCCQKKASLSI